MIPRGACHPKQIPRTPAAQPGRLGRGTAPAPSVPRYSRSGGVGLEERGQRVPPLGTACAQARQLVISRAPLALPVVGWPLSVPAVRHRSVSLTASTMHPGHAPREGGTDLLGGGEPAAAVGQRRALLEVLPRLPQAAPGRPLQRECRGLGSAAAPRPNPSPRGAVGGAGGLVPCWGSVLGGDPSALALPEPSRRCSARNPPVPEETARHGASAQEPSGRVLLPRAWMGKLRHAGDTAGGLQGQGHVQTSRSLPRLPARRVAVPCPGALPAPCHHRYSSRS